MRTLLWWCVGVAALCALGAVAVAWWRSFSYECEHPEAGDE